MDPFASAREQAVAIRRREVSSVELTRMYLERIEKHNKQLNAYFLVTPELALEQASSALVREGREESGGRLAGVPVSVKDLVCLAGYPTTYGSAAYKDFVTDFDQFPVARLKEGGCPILGKTTSPEFGSRPVTEFGFHGTARNPWNPDHTTGGSSGGAGGALAAGLCALSHGTDGGGSVRIPASCCGLVGLKPSRGRISRGPVQGEGWAGLSTDGVLARTVEDAAAGLDAMAGHLPGDPYWAELDGSLLDRLREPKGLRVAFTTETNVPVHPEIAACVERAASICEEAGHRVEQHGPASDQPAARNDVGRAADRRPTGRRAARRAGDPGPGAPAPGGDALEGPPPAGICLTSFAYRAAGAGPAPEDSTGHPAHAGSG